MRAVRRAKKDSSLETELKAYILGELSEEEEEGFNRRVIAGSSEFVQELDDMAEVVQDEMLDDYLAGKLEHSQKAAIESRFLTCDRMRDKLIVATALRAAAERSKSPLDHLRAWVPTVLRPAPAFAFATCATLALVAGGAWSIYRIGSLEADLAASRNRPVVVAQAPSPQKPETPPREADVVKPAVPLVSRTLPASIVLRPGLVRSGGALAQVRLSSGQNLIELRLDIGIDEYPRYRAAIHDSGDIEILVMSNLRPVKAGNSVEVRMLIPAQVIPADDYQVRLSGLTAAGSTAPIDSYPFRVIR